METPRRQAFLGFSSQARRFLLLHLLQTVYSRCRQGNLIVTDPQAHPNRSQSNRLPRDIGMHRSLQRPLPAAEAAP